MQQDGRLAETLKIKFLENLYKIWYQNTTPYVRGRLETSRQLKVSQKTGPVVTNQYQRIIHSNQDGNTGKINP